MPSDKDMEVIIKKGQRSDLAGVLNLVKGLAKFEKAEDQVTATLADYEREFDRDLISIDCAFANAEMVGCTLYYNTFSTWRGKMLYLEDFYVLEKFRGKGIGKMLFDEFIAESKRRNCTMVKWQVLDWNKAAIKFYEREGATIETEWWNGKIIY